jgi:hypothetical protein
MWNRQLQKASQNLPKQDSYRAERRDLVRYQVQSPEESPDFATARVNSLRGVVTGQDGTLHEGLLAKVSQGEKTSVSDLDDYSEVRQPRAVIGPVIEQYIGANLLNRITQVGYKKVIDPIVNNLSRDPLYFSAVKREMKARRRRARSGVARSAGPGATCRQGSTGH